MSIFSHIGGLSISNFNNNQYNEQNNEENNEENNTPTCTVNCYENNNTVTFDNYVSLCNTIKSQCPGLSDTDIGSTVDTYLQNITNILHSDQLNLEQNQSDEIVIDTDLEIITQNNQLNTSEIETDYLSGLAEHPTLINIDCVNKKPQRIINNTLGKYCMKKNTEMPSNVSELLEHSCPICIDNIDDDDYIRLLPVCEHYFHKKCIDKWFKTNDSCPCCRHIYF